jgi:hypothetical protein
VARALPRRRRGRSARPFSLPELEDVVDSFALVVTEDEDANTRLALAFELRPGRAAPSTDPDPLRQRVLGRVAELNQDYREAQCFMPVEAQSTLERHAHGTGPFAGGGIRLKRHYVHGDD